MRQSYNAGAGSGTVPTTVTGLNPSDTPTLAAGTSLTPPANQTFTGWNCDQSIGNKSAGESATQPSANVVCTAKWSENSPQVIPASADVKKATRDSSIGKRGDDQILQPLVNDVLLNSSKWNLSTMRLCGPRQSAPKCTLSSLDIKGEGTYTIDSKGRVTFTPEPDFVGEATSVKYQVTNNRGRVVAANINVTVLDQELPQSGSDSQTMLLLALLLIFTGAIQCSIQRHRNRSG